MQIDAVADQVHIRIIGIHNMPQIFGTLRLKAIYLYMQ